MRRLPHRRARRVEIETEPEDPSYVRSPGVTLTFSRCYTESDGGMSCLTCHDPHRDAEQSAAFYEAKCLALPLATAAPSGERRPPAHDRAARPAGRPICPVNPTKDCLDCHMPKVPVAVLHTSLTDHYIRVHDEQAGKTGMNRTVKSS